jgi:hypothetical protein
MKPTGVVTGAGAATASGAALAWVSASTIADWVVAVGVTPDTGAIRVGACSSASATDVMSTELVGADKVEVFDGGVRAEAADVDRAWRWVVDAAMGSLESWPVLGSEMGLLVSVVDGRPVVEFVELVEPLVTAPPVLTATPDGAVPFSDGDAS